MTDTPKKLVVNIEKGTQEYIDLTPAEIAERDQQAAAFAQEQKAREAEQATIETAKNTAILKLTKLGLTAEEIAALLK